TTPARPAPRKCSANASGSGSRASPGLSSRTNSNGRFAVAAVSGGVSHRNAANGASASSAPNQERKSASCCQRRRPSAQETGDEARSMATLRTRPPDSRSLRVVHMSLAVASALIFAHELPFRQDVPLHGVEQVLPGGAFFEVQRGVQGVDAEE